MKYFLIATALVVPAMVSAQTTNLGTLLDSIEGVVRLLIPVTLTLALLYFFWGVTEYVRKTGEGSVGEGRSKMFWGIIGLFVITSVWGIISFFGQDLGLETVQNRTFVPPTPNPCLDVQNRIAPYKDDPNCVRSQTEIPRNESERLLEELYN